MRQVAQVFRRRGARGRVAECLVYLDGESIDPSWGIAGFVDTETTGRDHDTDEIVELALVLFAFDRNTGRIMGIVDEYVGLREPAVPIHPGAYRVHGITLKDVRGKRLDNVRIEAMLDRAEFLVAHNERFDRGFVARLFPKCKSKKWLCSMRGIDWRRHGFNSKKLENLLQCHGIRTEQEHRAGSDARDAVLLLSQRSRDGQSYFLELLRHYQPIGGSAIVRSCDGAPTRSWIFQCNPRRFDIDRYLTENDGPLGWFVRQKHFLDQISEGDEVFIWRSDGGRKETGGIIAKARVVSSPDEMSGRGLKSYYRTNEWRHAGIGVWLEILEARLGDGMIKKSSLLTHRVLKDLRILRVPVETNYLLTKEEAAEIRRLWNM
ncbi:MAG: EVE domain-containing protein [Firmicutes bacterium]|nr:EVE domain-containing protein [Bacillota bacterium]